MTHQYKKLPVTMKCGCSLTSCPGHHSLWMQFNVMPIASRTSSPVIVVIQASSCEHRSISQLCWCQHGVTNSDPVVKHYNFTFGLWLHKLPTSARTPGCIRRRHRFCTFHVRTTEQSVIAPSLSLLLRSGTVCRHRSRRRRPFFISEGR